MSATLSRCAAAHPVGERSQDAPQRTQWVSSRNVGTRSGQWVVGSVGREPVGRERRCGAAPSRDAFMGAFARRAAQHAER